jgi:hypothetical protein
MSGCEIEITGTADATKGAKVTEVTIIGRQGKVTIGESTTKEVESNLFTKSTTVKVPSHPDGGFFLLICVATPDGERAIKSDYTNGQAIKIDIVSKPKAQKKQENIEIDLGGGDDDALNIIKAYDDEAVRIGKDVAATIANAVTAAAMSIIAVIESKPKGK